MEQAETTAGTVVVHAVAGTVPLRDGTEPATMDENITSPRSGAQMSRRPVTNSDEVLNRIREAASLIRTETSLRKVARDVGMSPTGLSKFMEGAQPYAHTYSKLRNWYVRKGTHLSPLDTNDAQAAIDMLTGHLPDREKAECQGRLLEVLAEAPATSRPSWVTELLSAADQDHG